VSSPSYRGYRVPEKSILTGTLAKKIQIKGRLEMEIGQIGATIALALLLVVLTLASSFLGWEGLPLILRGSVIALIAWGGKMAIFDHPGGMKHADWLVLWYRYRNRKQAGQLDYRPQNRRRARLHRAQRLAVGDDEKQINIEDVTTGIAVASGLTSERLTPAELTSLATQEALPNGGTQWWERNNSAA
jgi:hypothetical protein